MGLYCAVVLGLPPADKARFCIADRSVNQVSVDDSYPALWTIPGGDGRYVGSALRMLRQR